MTMTMDVEMYQKATKLQKRGALLEVGFTKFKGDMSMGGPKMPIPGIEDMTKLRMSMQMSDRGEMTDPKLLNPDDINTQMKQVADSMRNSLTQNSLVFPEKGLSPGDTWSIEQDLPPPIPSAEDMKMKLKSVYKLVSIDQVQGKPCAKISADVKLSLHGDADQGGVPVRADMEGTGTGTNLFFVDDGKMLSSDAKFNVGGSVVATAQGQKVATKLKMDVDLKLKLK
jgi:hypothetical protein